MTKDFYDEEDNGDRIRDFENLEKENKVLRKEIDKLLKSKTKIPRTRVWKKINELIDNELEQEELCD
jgi:hypothetical protein